ncbi:DNA-directed RNA polymerase I subunit RPA2, partial [Stegodyphus mimosarum]
MDCARGIENFLATGNFIPRYESSLMQTSGLTVIADKLNFWRYLSHFRSVHRGAFFAQMRTTEVRKLRPESWGFLCPVQTPDGAPC